MMIYLFSHFIKVVGYQKEGYLALREFSSLMTELDMRPVFNARRFGKTAKPTIKKIHVAYTKDKLQFHFHINNLKELTALLDSKGIKYETERIEMYVPTEIELELMPGYSPRGDQPKLIDYILDDGATKILNLQTGQGKTFTSLAAAVKRKGKILISIEARFFNLWAEALEGSKQILNVDIKEEVLFIKGSDQLKHVMKKALAGELEEIKVFVVSARTLVIYLEQYNAANTEIESVYPVLPENFYQTLDITTRIKDEVHLNLGSNFYEELHLHVPKNISLSATLEDGTYRDKLFGIMFPKEQRSPEVEYLKYIKVTALFYGMHNADRAVTSNRGMSDYNHIAFEMWIMKNKKVKETYFEMIYEWTIGRYVSNKVDKQKALIFVASTEMATELHKFLSKKLKDVNVVRYCASVGDDYKKAAEGDLMITTPKSFGTGFDLVDLICVLQTIALNAQSTQLQMMGRCRVLKNYPDLDPIFDYLTCVDLPKHMEYHENKKKQFIGKCKEHKSVFLKTVL